MSVFAVGPGSSAVNAIAVTPDNSDLAQNFRALYIGQPGDVSIRPEGQQYATTPQDVTFRDVPAGQYIYCCCCRVNATGTTALNIVGLI